jgi:hypothetical protein
VSGLHDLREALRAAARRDQRSRRRRRAAVAVTVLLLGGAAAAGATDLMSTGPPAPDPRPHSERYAAQHVRIVLQAQRFAVGIYSSKGGDACALAGRHVGSRLGIVEKGVFRPFAPERMGACGSPRRSWIDGITVDGRELVFGRAAPQVRWVRLGRERVRPGVGGAFLFVRDGPARSFDVRFE